MPNTPCAKEESAYTPDHNPHERGGADERRKDAAGPGQSQWDVNGPGPDYAVSVPLSSWDYSGLHADQLMAAAGCRC